MTTTDTAVREALRELGRIKAPTKRAAYIADAITRLPSQEAVVEFTAELRRRAGVQDVALLQGDVWRIDTLKGDWHAGQTDFSRRDVLNLAGKAEAVEIHWPSLWQYGTAVFFTLGTTRYRAHTPDWGPSETYLSM